MRASCAWASATCASRHLEVAALWSTALWLMKFCATSSWLRCRLVRAMLACGLGLLQLRLLQRVVELHQQLAAPHALAVAEVEPRDAAADLGAQHHALARTQAAHGLRVVVRARIASTRPTSTGTGPLGAARRPPGGAVAGRVAGRRWSRSRLRRRAVLPPPGRTPAPSMPTTATTV